MAPLWLRSSLVAVSRPMVSVSPESLCKALEPVSNMNLFNPLTLWLSFCASSFLQRWAQVLKAIVLCAYDSMQMQSSFLIHLYGKPVAKLLLRVNLLQLSINPVCHESTQCSAVLSCSTCCFLLCLWCQPKGERHSLMKQLCYCCGINEFDEIISCSPLCPSLGDLEHL